MDRCVPLHPACASKVNGKKSVQTPNLEQRVTITPLGLDSVHVGSGIQANMCTALFP